MRIIISFFILTLFVSCNKEEAPKTSLTVASFNFPVKWCIDTISANSVKNIYLIPPGQDPAYWSPTDQQIHQVAVLRRIFLNGAGYEKWFKTFYLDNILDTSKPFEDKFIRQKGESHLHNGVTHSHDELDFNTWLDFDLFKIQAEQIALELQKLSPKSSVDFLANLKTIHQNLDELKQQFKDATSCQKKFLASHPVYNYFARSLNLELVNFHWEPNVMPSEDEWKKLADSTAFSKLMLWEESPSQEISEKLKQLGISVIVFRPCGNIPPSGDFIREMQENLQNLKKALKK